MISRLSKSRSQVNYPHNIQHNKGKQLICRFICFYSIILMS